MKTNMVLNDLFEKFIRGSRQEALVVNARRQLTEVSLEASEVFAVSEVVVYVTSRMVKHIFDAKPAEEFHFILDHLHLLIERPNEIYLNKVSKRGQFCLVKKIKGEYYFCPLEIVSGDSDQEDNQPGIYVVTAFRLRRNEKEKYLRNYKLIWSWRDDVPSSPR